MLESLPTYPTTTPLSLQHQQLIDDYNQLYASTIGALTFTNLFVMDTKNTTRLSTLHENLLIIQDTSLTIHGTNNLSQTIQHLQDEPFTLEIWDDTVPGFIADYDNAEYLYSVEDVVRMEGATYANVRRKIHACQKRGNWTFRDIDTGWYDRMWELSLAGTHRQDLDALEKYLAFAPTLNAETWGIFRDEELYGFVVVEALPSATLLIHFFKTDHAITGLAGYLFYSVATKWEEQMATINFEQDLGLPGLRQFKQSLRPLSLRTPYVLLDKPPTPGVGH